MITLIQLDDSKNPIGVIKYMEADDAVVKPTNTKQIVGDLPVTFEELCVQWRWVDDVLTNVGPPPSKYYEWCPLDETWKVNLELGKQLAWEAIKKSRTLAEFGGIRFEGNQFDTNSVSQSRIHNAALLALIYRQKGLPYQLEWTLADNKTVMLDSDSIINLSTAVSEHVSKVHQHARELRLLIEAADERTLDAISWSLE